MVKNSSKQTVTWEAEEYILRSKNTGWYIGFAIVVLALVAISILLEWWTFTVLIVLSAIALILYSSRPPRKLKYKLDEKGLTEGEKLYPFGDYKNFGVLNDDNEYAIVMTPIKRFSPRVMVYFPKKDGEVIVDMFGARLPMEDIKLDYLDKIVRKLRI